MAFDDWRSSVKSLVDALTKKGRVLISDGAWGTQLHKRGLQAGTCPESWNITHRADVMSVAQGYVDADADMILTNSFGGHPLKLAHFGFDSRAAELNEAAAAISREAAGPERFVLGSMGPTGVVLMMGEVPEEVVYEGYCVQAQALERGGVDVLCIETMSAVDEACLAIRAARSVTRCEIACTFTFEKGAAGFRTMMGVSPEEMVQALAEAGADIIGANCGNGIDGMVEVVRAIRAVTVTTPVLVHANAGKPIFRDGVTVFPETPEDMAAKVSDLVTAGANIIGGCCGTGPEHIRAMAGIIKRQ
jgi:5-methyltetrahydrofolate--homocysteine methyltransferase